MNDSFLEDLDLIPKEAKSHSVQAKQRVHITKRKVLSPPPKSIFKSNIEKDDLKQDKIISSSSSNVPKTNLSRQNRVQEPRRLYQIPSAKPLSSTPKSDKKEQSSSETLKPIENKIESTDSKPKAKECTSPKLKEKKIITNKPRIRSGSTGSLNHVEAAKENTQPSEYFTSNDSSSHQELIKSGNNSDSILPSKDHRPRSVNSLSSIESGSCNIKKDQVSSEKKIDILEKSDPVMLLNAIKDIVKGYTENEATKILRAMQDLYINSQANLIKQTMLQTDDLIRELNLKKSNENVQSLIEENERMREDIFILRTRNEVMQKRINELSLIKEENVSLKLKLKELRGAENEDL